MSNDDSAIDSVPSQAVRKSKRSDAYPHVAYVNLSEEHEEYLRAMQAALGKTRSEIIREAILEKCAALVKPNATEE